MQRALRGAVDVALVAVVGIVLAGAIGTRAIAASGQLPIVIAGGSMEPTIPVGALAIVRPVPADDLQPGDVVLFQADAGRSPYTHRITRIVQRDGAVWLELKGDANHAPDPVLVPVTGVVGRVGASVPVAGRLVSALTTGGGLLAVAGLAGLLYTLTLVLEPGGAPSRAPRRAGTASVIPGGRSVRVDGPASVG